MGLRTPNTPQARHRLFPDLDIEIGQRLTDDNKHGTTLQATCNCLEQFRAAFSDQFPVTPLRGRGYHPLMQ
eukprot:15472819-Alexandrium_andersonii.AAC.1